MCQPQYRIFNNKGKNQWLNSPLLPYPKEQDKRRPTLIAKCLGQVQTSNFHFSLQNAPAIVERIGKFETLESKIIPSIFANKDCSHLFRMFQDPIEDLIKEFFANAWFTGDELKCWVHRKNFVITLDYLASILQIDPFEDADMTLYDDRFTSLDPILAC